VFTESTLDEIRARTDIVELISEYVQLKKSGSGFTGLCPFHNEKTPSFHVQPVRQIFRCFGCNKGGNVFSFIQACEGMSFPEAVRRLAKRAGVEVREDSQFRKKSEPVAPGNQRLFEACDWAAKYFHYLLMESAEHEHARKYIKSRGISKKTVEEFRIGVSPKGWSTLLNLMLKRNFTFKELVDAGLVTQKEGSTSDGYDRFRNRLMFPITDKDGNTIAFGGRKLDENEEAKYLNSSESPLFSKKRTLYGIFENQRGIRLRGEAIIVEGYMDVVGLFEAGVNNAVAVMGTALTEEHCQILRTLTPKVVTVFDPDRAGVEAWRRSVPLFMQAKILAKDLTLPENVDPDEFVRKEGADIFYQLCEKAPQQVTKYLKEIATKGALSEEETSKHLQDLMPLLIATRNLPTRATLWDDISRVLKIDVPMLRDLVERAVNRSSQLKVPPKGSAGAQRTARPQASKRFERPFERFHPMDLEFFQAAITHPEAFLHWPEEAWVGALRDKKLEETLLLLKHSAGVEQFDKLLESLSQSADEPDIGALATAGLFRGEVPKNANPNSQNPFGAVAEAMRKRKRDQEIEVLATQVKLVQRLGDEKEQMRLLEKLRQLRTS
jgi:DNA primase